MAIIKHANPCGVALGADVKSAYIRALQCDPVSAFGGIVAINRRLDAAAAREMAKIFTEVVIAPEADEEAIAVFAGRKNLRLLITGGLADPARPGEVFKSIAGGILVQARDAARLTAADLKVITPARAQRARSRRHAVRVHRRQACEVQLRHRLRQVARPPASGPAR